MYLRIQAHILTFSLRFVRPAIFTSLIDECMFVVFALGFVYLCIFIDKEKVNCVFLSFDFVSHLFLFD